MFFWQRIKKAMLFVATLIFSGILFSSCTKIEQSAMMIRKAIQNDAYEQGNIQKERQRHFFLENLTECKRNPKMDTPSCYNAAMCLEYGSGTKKNISEAKKYFSYACSDTRKAMYTFRWRACYQLAKLQKNTEALIRANEKICFDPANYGKNGCYRAGKLLLKQKNYRDAVKFLKLGCNNGRGIMPFNFSTKGDDGGTDRDACHLLGKMYEKGIGVRKSMATAANYYRDSCESLNCKYASDFVRAQKVEAEISRNIKEAEDARNIGNYQTAYNLYMKNCKFGILDDCAKAEEIVARGNLPGKKQDVVQTFQKLCMQGNKSSCDDLAEMFYKGQGVPKNWELALYFFAKGEGTSLRAIRNHGASYDYRFLLFSLLYNRQKSIQSRNTISLFCMNSQSASDFMKPLSNYVPVFNAEKAFRKSRMDTRYIRNIMNNFTPKNNNLLAIFGIWRYMQDAYYPSITITSNPLYGTMRYNHLLYEINNISRIFAADLGNLNFMIGSSIYQHFHIKQSVNYNNILYNTYWVLRHHPHFNFAKFLLEIAYTARANIQYTTKNIPLDPRLSRLILATGGFGGSVGPGDIISYNYPRDNGAILPRFNKIAWQMMNPKIYVAHISNRISIPLMHPLTIKGAQINTYLYRDYLIGKERWYAAKGALLCTVENTPQTRIAILKTILYLSQQNFNGLKRLAYQLDTPEFEKYYKLFTSVYYICPLSEKDIQKKLIAE